MLTQSLLQSLFHYNPITGLFTRLQAPNWGRVGDVAGCTSRSTGYVQIKYKYKKYLAHRLAFLYMTGSFPEFEVDHRNGVRSDNRWMNLRESTRPENAHNIGGAKATSKTGVLGIYKSGGKFAARIGVNNTRTYLGTFDTAADAHAAYMRAKDALHPTHLRLKGCEL